ncbi:MAG TPA: SDR family oxidoreductase [Caulobacterales bacterium]|nr:SDR family oxidoreductase [Caulobacterales bacterium]
MAKQQDRKSIFVTGAGSGIGRATALLFAERGYFVGAFDVDENGLSETAALLPEGQRLSHVFDVRDRDGWKRAVRYFGEATGGVMHVLFNNAGVARGGWFEDISEDDAELIVDVNVKGVINGCYAALPLLREATGGRIVNVASVAGVYGAPRMAVYSATKFAVRGLTEALDLEFARHGVRVASLMPWFVDTAILDGTIAGGNDSFRQGLTSGKVEIYPVRLAAERAWDAAHGAKLHYMAGKQAERARFAARFMPGVMRERFRKMIGAVV